MARSITSQPTSPFLILGTVLLAGSGQIFLAQADRPWTLLPGLLGYGLAFCLLLRKKPQNLSPEPKPLSLRTEWVLLGFILLVALGFRLYLLDSIPSGMHTDQGLEGQSAQRIAFEGWRPFFEVFNYHVPEVFMYYQLALWFKLFGSSYKTFHVFFALFSLAAFPLIYWTFRQLSGPRVALLALFLLSVMRWHWIFSRNGFPTIQVPFYLFGTLGFWLFGLKKGNRWALFISALFLGLGLYTYQSFKAVPLLMLILAAFELWKNKKDAGSLRRSFLFFFLLAGLLAVPLVGYMLQHQSFGNRERELFILKQVQEEKSLLPLARNTFGTIMMFNRAGDTNPRHNIPGHRMLDDVTGVFFVLGLGLAWSRRRERGAFYALAGFLVMSLPCLLSTDIAHANRLLALTPFVAWMGASAMEHFAQVLVKRVDSRAWVLAFLFLILGSITILNFRAYFFQQAETYDCWKGYGPEQNFIGKTIEQCERTEPGQRVYFITPAYFGNHTIAFLGYPAGYRVQVLSGLEPFSPKEWNTDKRALFFLEEGKSGWVDFLQTLYPNGKLGKLLDRDGHVLVYTLEVLSADLKTFKGWNQGLKGTYIPSSRWNAKPLVIKTDPLLNFTYKGDLPFTDYPPFRVRWTGALEIPQKGAYQFQVLTTDKAQLWLDGKMVPLEKPLTLTAKGHSLRLDFEKEDGDSLALHLIWKKPGADKWEIIPAAAFGIIR